MIGWAFYPDKKNNVKHNNKVVWYFFLYSFKELDKVVNNDLERLKR